MVLSSLLEGRRLQSGGVPPPNLDGFPPYTDLPSAPACFPICESVMGHQHCLFVPDTPIINLTSFFIL